MEISGRKLQTGSSLATSKVRGKPPVNTSNTTQTSPDTGLSTETFQESLGQLKFGESATGPRPPRSVARHTRNLVSFERLKEEFISLDGTERDLDSRPGGVQLGGTSRDIDEGRATGTLTPGGQFAVAFYQTSTQLVKHLATDFSQEPQEVVDLRIWRGKTEGSKKSQASNGDMTTSEIYLDSLWPLVEGRNLFYPTASEINHSNALVFDEPKMIHPGLDEEDDGMIANHKTKVQNLLDHREFFLSLDGTDADLDPREGGVRLAVPEEDNQTANQISGTLTPSGEFLLAQKTIVDGRTKTKYLATTFGEEQLEVLNFSSAPRQSYTTVDRGSLDENGVLSSSKADPGLWMMVSKEYFFPTEPKTEPEVLFRSSRAKDRTGEI